MQAASGFTREKMIEKLRSNAVWDLIIIGGGATGLGTALDSALRGYKTLLLEQSDFAKGTSSRSTKLVHGGVRYLAQGNIKLVYHALRERGLLLKNAPHLVKKQNFIIPVYTLWSKLKYLVGLKLYDWLSKSLSFGSSSFLSRQQVLQEFPNLESKNLLGGIEYFDGQFDDARLAINLAQTAAEEGAVMLNYFQVSALVKTSGKVSGVECLDLESGNRYRVEGKSVINATGVFVDDILRLDNDGSKAMVSPSQGVHIVLNRSLLDSKSALMIPETRDGRVLFAIPWHEHLLIGTTDTPVSEHQLEPKPLKQEIDFILETVGQFIDPKPAVGDVLSVFAGLRPLAAITENTKTTKEISRDHKLVVSESGLITITGGKWTTYRQMAEETVNKAITIGHLDRKVSGTSQRKIHGYVNSAAAGSLSIYGSDAEKIKALQELDPVGHTTVIKGFPQTKAEVVWAIRNEMARTVEDILARRFRILFLDARAAKEAAPVIAAIMAEELGYDESWKANQVDGFGKLVLQYLP
ncbi:MAG: glycerol-3-phosphate dehydrogenase/oxidase [Chitinophagaceae bacterium]